MKKYLIAFCCLCSSLFLSQCGPGDWKDNFPMNQPHWKPKDYDGFIYVLRNRKDDHKPLPSLSDPQTAPIFKKITDQENIAVVTEDESLGLKYKASFINDMFEHFKDLVEAYSGMNKQDKYIYPEELVMIRRFGLYIQLPYIKLQNRKIKQKADDPDSDHVRDILERNRQVAISNYNLYLDCIKRERSFNDAAIELYIEGLKKYFPRLLKTFPDTDYASMLSKLDDMKDKTSRQDVNNALDYVQQKVETHKEERTALRK